MRVLDVMQKGIISVSPELALKDFEELLTVRKLPDRSYEVLGRVSVRDFNRDNRSMVVEAIPEGTCMVHFNGHGKPWHPATQKLHPWVVGYIPEWMEAP